MVIPGVLRLPGKAGKMGLLFLLLTSLSLSGLWAGYKKLKVKVEPVTAYPFRSAQSQLTIAADPYNHPEKVLTAFDLKKMLEREIVPIHLILSNEGDHVITVNGEAIQLLDDKSRPAEALRVEEVMQLLFNSSPRQTMGPRFPIPKVGGGSSGDQFEIETDLTQKSLKSVRVNPKSIQDGFVFFRVPPEAQSLKGYRVYIPELRDLTGGQDLIFFEIDLN
jgi:hypothetical protein